jgi:DUF917 family protein
VLSAMMGAPTVLVGEASTRDEVIRAFEALQERLDRQIAHTVSVAARGLNSTIPFVVAARMVNPAALRGRHGRAFPEVQMVTPTIHGIAATPMALADEKGQHLRDRDDRPVLLL